MVMQMYQPGAARPPGRAGAAGERGRELANPDTFLPNPVPHHWTDEWIGTPWREGRFECVDLVREVLRTQYGRRLMLPPWLDEGLRPWRRLAGDLAVRVPADAARDGDVVHMGPAGGGRGRSHHLGIRVELPGMRAAILHCAAEINTCLHPPESLLPLGFRLRGYYRLSGSVERTNGMA